MSMTIHCDIVSAEEEIFSGLIEMLVATGDLGELGVTYGHAPLLTSLKPGPVRIVAQDGEELVYYVSGGFLEVRCSFSLALPGFVQHIQRHLLRCRIRPKDCPQENQSLAPEIAQLMKKFAPGIFSMSLW